MLTRRVLLRGSAVAIAGAGALPGWLARATQSVDPPGARKKILVAIFQRGAADGLNIVVPFAEKNYYAMRPSIAIAAPGSTNVQNPGPFGGAAIDLDGRFGLNPALESLKPLWNRKQLAIVEATGSPDPSRSHFDAQDYMESGTPGKSTSDGWMNRALPEPTPETSPLRAIAMGSQLPRTLRGDRAAIAVNNNQTFQLGNQDTASILESMYSATHDPRLGHPGKDAFAAMKMIRTVNQQQYTPAQGAQYQQGGELGRNLQQVARLIKGDVGVEAAFAEVDGWDHHGNEANQLSNMLRQFGTALSAFCTDMGDRMEDIVLVTMSEFGRTAEENGNGGTDHGHGSVMMVLGGSVAGGKIYGNWPGLEKEQLNEGRDLAVTTDFRAVLSELVTGQLAQKDLTHVFPGYQPGTPLGLLRA
jgi:uncharacterized protein (DUF1501 family)